MRARSRGRRAYRPRYRRLLDSGQMPERVEALVSGLGACRLCPRACGVNRIKGETGFCRTGRWARVARSCLHRGEEPPLTGSLGSGTIFFAGCNLRCLYCQNHQISQADIQDFPEMTAEALATEALRLQGQGAHNINFVSPSHVLPQMVEAISLAAAQGLAVPVVCNCNAYETSDSLRKMEGFVDIYLPDLKYTRAQTAATLSGGPDYPSVALESMKEMYRQVGPLQTDESGVARSGVIVRHLVLPGRVDESLEVLETLRRHFGRGIALSLMAQYYPAHLADDSNGLHRRLTGREYRTIVDAAQNLGLDDLWTQEPSSAGHYRPDFHQHHPFEF